MGAAAEMRYKAFAAREAEAAQPSVNELFLADLNALPKYQDAPTPFGDVHFINSHGGWFAECPVTGFGYFYKSLREAVRSWRVAVFADRGVLVGQPFTLTKTGGYDASDQNTIPRPLKREG